MYKENLFLMLFGASSIVLLFYTLEPMIDIYLKYIDGKMSRHLIAIVLFFLFIACFMLLSVFK